MKWMDVFLWNFGLLCFLLRDWGINNFLPLLSINILHPNLNLNRRIQIKLTFFRCRNHLDKLYVLSRDENKNREWNGGITSLIVVVIRAENTFEWTKFSQFVQFSFCLRRRVFSVCFGWTLFRNNHCFSSICVDQF